MKFVIPEVEIIKFSDIEVLTASGGGSDDRFDEEEI